MVNALHHSTLINHKITISRRIYNHFYDIGHRREIIKSMSEKHLSIDLTKERNEKELKDNREDSL